ncbi:MAG: hypothetical protein RDU13_11225 [Elusimicrobiales bacterium]|nr:hypothetical protein [Elusimicrobiales bacterium]
MVTGGSVVVFMSLFFSPEIFAGTTLQKNPYPDKGSRIEFSTHTVFLSPKMHEAVHAYSKNFELRPAAYYPEEIRRYYPYTTYQSPTAVFGDFNGDRMTDSVLIGDDGAFSMTLMLLSSYDPKSGGLSYAVRVFSRIPLSEAESKRIGTWSYLQLRKKGRFQVPNDESELEEVELKNDGFEVIIWEKAAVVYYLDESGDLKKIVSAD